MGDADAGVWGSLDTLVSEVLQTRSQIARLQAREARLLASAVDLVAARAAERKAQGRRDFGTQLALREVCAELGVAMRVSDRTVQGRISDASSLVSSFPATLGAWEAGRIDAAHVTAIVEAGVAIGDDVLRAQYEDVVLVVAESESANRMRSLARDIAGRIDASTLEDRQQRAQLRRRVQLLDLDDGMARIILDLPATLAHAVLDRVTQMAREVLRAADEANEGDAAATGDPAPERGHFDSLALAQCGSPRRDEGPTARDDASRMAGTSGPPTDSSPDDDASGATGIKVTTTPRRSASVGEETRSMDELRADILADLLLTGTPTAHGEGGALGAITAHVQVTVPVLTLAGASDEPALLAGHGPIDPDTARRLAAGAPGWDRVMTHPHTGLPLAVDRYRPSAELRRFLRARDEHCRFPGCRQPTWRCDVDHTIDAAYGGATSDGNLAHFCRSHHTLKHASDWRVHQHGGGVLTWTAPTGRTYRDRSPSTVRFVPDRSTPDSYSTDPPPF